MSPRFATVLFCMLLLAASRGQAACDGCTNFSGATLFGRVNVGSLSEISGVASSVRNHGVLWIHNDGSPSRIQAVSTNGALLASVGITKSVDDLEDIAVGPGPSNGVSYLYLGDIGGSEGTNIVRADVKIVRAPEPRIELAWATNSRSPELDGAETFMLVYPDGSYDAETLLVDAQTSDLFVITKQFGTARVYRANLNSATNRATVTLDYVTAVSFSQASGGSMSADGSQIALRRENAAWLWRRCDGENIATTLAKAPTSLLVVGPPDEPNGEGIGFLADGTGLVTTTEGTNSPIYFFRALCPSAPRFTLSPSDVSLFAGATAEFRGYAVGFPNPTYTWRFNGTVLPGRTTPTLILSNITAAQAGNYDLVASNSSGSVTNRAVLTVRARPDLRITEVMSNPSGGAGTADWWELTSFESQPVSLTGWRFNDNGGGLNDPFTITGPLSIAPGESIVFVENLNVAQFQSWWGTNLAAATQIVPYAGNGLSLGANGDGLRLWDNATANVADTVASVDFGASPTGVTFTYDLATQGLSGLSQAGVNGAWRSALGNDVGSPGRIRAVPLAPVLRVQLQPATVRISFEARAGYEYSLEAREDLAGGSWTPTGNSLNANTNGVVTFEPSRSASSRFYRVRVE